MSRANVGGAEVCGAASAATVCVALEFFRGWFAARGGAVPNSRLIDAATQKAILPGGHFRGIRDIFSGPGSAEVESLPFAIAS